MATKDDIMAMKDDMASSKNEPDLSNDGYKEKKTSSNCRKYCAIVGSFLLIIPSGIYSMWGNISVYALSYVYKYHGMSRYIQTPWEVSAYLLSMYIGYNSTGYFLKFCNKRLLLFLIIFVSNGGYFVAFIALKSDIISLSASIVFLLGFSIGVVESVVFKHIADWSGTKKGYLISIACSGMNFGPFIVNPIITAYVNPGNLSPNASEGRFKFITHDQVMDKVPSLFALLGSMFLGLQIIGFIFLNLHQPDNSTTEDLSCNNYGSLSNTKSEDKDLNVCETDKSNTDDNTNSNSTQRISDCNNSQARSEDGSTPCQTLRSSIFYILWLCNACRDSSTILLNSYYKSFGQNWIKDDYLLTALGSVLGITGGFVRMTWGFVLDRHKLKNCLVFVFSSVAFGMLLMYFTPRLGGWLYFIVTVFYASVHSCLFPTVVSSTLVLFGKSHFNHNLGLVNTASMVADVVVPPVFASLLEHFGWFWVFGSTVSLFTFTLIIIISRFPHELEREQQP